MYVSLSRATDQSRIYIDTISHDPETGRELTPTEQHHAGLLELHDLANRSHRHTMASEHERDTGHVPLRELQQLQAREERTPDEQRRADAERASQDRDLREQLVARPPRYLQPLIGPVPMDASQRQEWTRDALRLENHRLQHQLTHEQMTRQIAAEVLGRGHERGRWHGRGRDR